MGCSPEEDEDEDGDEDESRNGSLALCPYATRRVTLVESRKTREGECLEKRKTEIWKERKEKHKKSQDCSVEKILGLGSIFGMYIQTCSF